MNTRSSALLALAAASALAVTGCARPSTTAGSSEPELPTTSVSTAASTSAPPATPKTNERGFLPKTLGQTSGLTGPNDTSIASFSIDKVTVDPPCSEFGSPPDSGHTLLVDVRVATTTDQDAAEQLSYLFGTGFVEIGKDGVTRPTQVGFCTEAMNSLPSTFGLNQKFAGQIELVVPEASGLLALNNGNVGGWEWKY
jgi:hypothetical protein